ncbi:hypothetical protein [Bradyrhizobium liaoningense]|uniref:hypothetical protein n=1 Tax=Bradyrhizobium liaoningense TaxID=43992 RepID=UPI001BAAFE4B|nr:hypothetical protein [Bradyrhizobium liaoningense]MBR0904575.1 hypothetical protein [Bradyrhizobium liaoningense]
MDQSSPSTAGSHTVVLWLVLALVVILGAGATYWLNQKIESVQAAATPRQESEITSLQQAIAEIQAGQQKLGEQVSQRVMAIDQGERKLLSEQIGALSSRVDALASAHADAQTQPQKNRRSKR